MKTIKILPILAVVLMLTTASTCHKDDDNPSVSNQQQIAMINAVNGTVMQGNWHVSYYFDNDSEETSNFSGYTFSFGSGGILTATNGSNTQTGSWFVSGSNSSNDDNPHPEDLDFNIAFSSPANFAELTDDWEIVTFTAARIELIDVSGGNGGTDRLIFEKN